MNSPFKTQNWQLILKGVGYSVHQDPIYLVVYKSIPLKWSMFPSGVPILQYKPCRLCLPSETRTPLLGGVNYYWTEEYDFLGKKRENMRYFWLNKMHQPWCHEQTGFINTRLCNVIFLKVLKFVMGIFGNWTAHISWACLIFTIYAVLLPELFITNFDLDFIKSYHAGR